MYFHLVTLGCQMNKSDGERVRTVVEKMGYVWTDNEEEASLLGILACSVRQKSIDKVYSRIYKWNKSKDKKNLITFLSGCVLPDDKKKFLKLFDIIFEMKELHYFYEMLQQYGVVTPLSLKQGNVQSEKRKLYVTELLQLSETDQTRKLNNLRPEEEIKNFWKVTPTYNSSYEAFIPIQNGCDKFCTFCAVPYTRGREVSRNSEEILSELKNLVNKGYKSITLLGQNVNSYGLDKKGNEISFPQLLKKIGEYGNKLNKKFWIYFTSPHPRDMTRDVIETIAQYKCLAKQIHLPIQSGDDKVLIKMNRKHSVSDYRKIIHDIKELMPHATIFTDIIVGFTGETDQQFENTRKVMEEFKFNMAYIAKYSPRPGATSSRWKDDVPNITKSNRLHILTRELTKHTLSYNQQLIGKSTQVLVIGKDRKEGYLSAITEGKIILRFNSTNESLIGKFVKVKIELATDYALEGTLVSDFVAEEIGA